MSAHATRRALTIRVAAAGVLSAAALALGACAAEPATPDRTYADSSFAHEQLIATCMSERGFEYVVAMPADATADIARQEAVIAGEDGESAYQQAVAAAPDDPNDALVAALPEDGQAVWVDALYGTDTTAGCYDLTYEEAWGTDYEQLTQEMADFNARVSAEPDVIAAVDVYADCMGAAGYAVPHPDGVEDNIAEQVAGLDAEAAQTYGDAMYAAHQTCVGPYEEAFSTAYDRLAAEG